MKNKTISVFGLGYVGCVSVACLAKAGHRVIGVEVNELKVDLINRGVATVVEPGLDALLLDGFDLGLITATSNAEAAIRESDIVLVTVGTPSMENGDLDLSHIFFVAEHIGLALKGLDRFITIAIRSTVKPGTCRKVAELIEILSGCKMGTGFAVVANPEFLREGTAIADYFNPPYVLIGVDNVSDSREIAKIYENLNANILVVNLTSAEIIKYVNNTWHALKVTFGNEVGTVCKALGIDSQEVMQLFFRDRILNISEHYLSPGHAFGGACLPKDLSALTALARSISIKTPLLDSIHPSNNAHIARAVALLRMQSTSLKLGFVGLSFKAGTDDVRNSPTVEVIKALLADGYDIRVLDEFVSQALSTGRNATSTGSILGPIQDLLVETVDDLLQHANVVVISKNEQFIDLVLDKIGDRILVDLVQIKKTGQISSNYHGLAWQ